MDILILGATLRGVQAALRLAGEGHCVRICTALSYPGEDALGTFAASCDQSIRARVLALCEKDTPPSPAGMKRGLFCALKSAGVRVDFYTRFTAALIRDGHVSGALLSGPQGIFSAPCACILDATTLGEPSFQTAGQGTILRAGAPLVLRQPFLLSGGALPPDAAPDPFDKRRAHMAKTLLLPEDMTPTGARNFLARERLSFLRALASDGRYAALSLDTALPCALETPPVAAPESGIGGFIRITEDTLPELSGLSAKEEAPDTVVLNGLSLPYDPGAGFTDAHVLALRKESHALLIAGGGTAGAWAAMAARAEGEAPFVIEKGAHFGGTRTLGGVSGLYCGNRSALFQRMWRALHDFAKDLPGGKPTPASEMLYFASRIGESARLCASICFSAAESGRIGAVLSVGEDGAFADAAEQVIDATGDGALCALAGCAFDLGDEKTRMTQNFSQWYRCAPDRRPYRPVDQDVMDATDHSEWARCAENALLSANEYDLFEVLTPRESRRIVGRDRMTLRGIVSGERTPDVIYDGFSTYDPHGRGFGLAGRLGALPALRLPLFAAVPLNALLPRCLNGALVVGKALSADQDGMNHFRMNADVMSIGWIAGQIAARCAQKHIDADALPLDGIQEALLRDGALIRPVPEKRTLALSAAALCARIITGEDPQAFSLAVLARPEGLKKLLISADESGCVSGREQTDMALLFYGDTRGAQRLIGRLASLDRKNGKMIYHDRQRDTGVILGGAIDGGDDYWRMNQLAVLLANAGEEQAIPAILSMLQNTVPGGGWENDTSVYASIRLDVNTLPNYDRALCLAHAIDDMPDPCFLPELERLMLDIAALPAPKAAIWRDYLLLRLLLAYARCGGDAGAMSPRLALNTQYRMIRDGLARLGL